ncbi:hypothetical protein [Brucella intermedia]|uniref:hypothetical protein n=1 Tax=Brucella intermedia TaxID=94625 RepID=UPI0023602743|nr:hypothetical protein [Brucella intermedia]
MTETPKAFSSMADFATSNARLRLLSPMLISPLQTAAKARRFSFNHRARSLLPSWAGLCGSSVCGGVAPAETRRGNDNESVAAGDQRLHFPLPLVSCSRHFFQLAGMDDRKLRYVVQFKVSIAI